MTWSQSLVLTWIHFAIAAAFLLVAARLALRWLTQPVERIRLILCTLVAVFAVPPLLLLSPWPVWRLGLVSPIENRVTVDESKSALSTLPTTVEQALHTLQPEPSTDDDVPNEQMLADTNVNVSERQHFPPIIQDSGQIASVPVAKPAVVLSSSVAPTAGSLSVWNIAALTIVMAHGLALLIFSIEWGLGAWWLSRLVRAAIPATRDVDAVWRRITQGRGGQVRVLVSSSIGAPLVFGWRHPVVLVPAELVAAEETALEFCLAHEWSHVEHGDILMWHAAWISQFFLWYQPWFWSLRKELRVCQDILADNRSTRAGLDSIEYSELLVGFARKKMTAPCVVALTFLDHPSQLTRRVKMLLQSQMSLRLRCTGKFSLAIAAAAVLATSLISAVRLDSIRAETAAVEIATPAGKVEVAKGENEAAADALTAVNSAATKETPATSTPATSTPATSTPAASTQEPLVPLTYTCRVVDKETGKGLPGARVTVRRSSLTAQHNRLIAETKHTTDADGNYQFEIPVDQLEDRYLYIELDVEHDDHASKNGHGYSMSMIRKNEKLGERPFFERTELYTGELVTGRLLSPAGAPLAGAKVQAFSMASRQDFHSTSFVDTVTDATGAFRLILHQDVEAVLWLLPKDFAIVETYLARKRGDLGEIRLQPGLRSQGRVLTADGQPAAGVAVNIEYVGERDLGGLPVDTSVRRSAISGEDGTFAFDPLPAGDYHVTPADYLMDPIVRDRTVYSLPGVFIASKWKLKEGAESPPIEIQAVPHVIFHAQYYDSKGQKTRGHAFHLFGELDGVWWFGQGKPDQEGTIALKVPHGLEKVRVNLMTNEHGALRYRSGKDEALHNEKRQIEFGTMNADVNGFEIIRYRAPVVLIAAVDDAGKPIKDFRVSATYPWGKQEYVLKGEQRSDLSFEHQDDGRYRTSQMLPDEEVTFTATAPGYQPASQMLKLPEGETKELTLTLKSGHAANLPAANLEPVRATAAASASVPLNYTGVIFDYETEKPIVGATVVVRLATLPYRVLSETKYMTGADGKYTFAIPPEQLAESSLFLAVDADHEKYALRRWTSSKDALSKTGVSQDRESFERLGLWPAEYVTGIVANPDGRPLEGIKVRLQSIKGSVVSGMNSGENSLSVVATGADGRFQLKAIKGATSILWLVPEEFAIVETFLGKDRGDLGEIRLQEGIRVSGRLLGTDGKPIAGAAVNISNAADETNSKIAPLRIASRLRRGMVTGDDGQFTFRPLPSGFYRVTVDEFVFEQFDQERSKHPIPDVFLQKTVILKSGTTASTVEIQALPHIVFQARIVDSKGEKITGQNVNISGEVDRVRWSSRAISDAQGAVSIRVPHGLQKASFGLPNNEYVFRYRKQNGDPVLRDDRGIPLGTLNSDVEDFLVVRYRAPVVLVTAVDQEKQPINDVNIIAKYVTPPPEFLYRNAATLSDIRFDRAPDGKLRTIQMRHDEEVTFNVSAKGYRSVAENVKLAEGETKELVVTMEKEPEAK